MKVLFVTNQFPSKKLPHKGNFFYSRSNEIQKLVEKIIVLAPNYARGKTHSI